MSKHFEEITREELDEIEIRLSNLEHQAGLTKQAEEPKLSPFDKFWLDNLHHIVEFDRSYTDTWNGALEAAIHELLLTSNDAERLRAIMK